MRLRRETGDFQIKVTQGQDGSLTVNSIRPGLSAEDLIGEVVSVNDSLTVVPTAKQEDAETVSFRVGPLTLDYHKATGEISEYTGT